jgi:formylglycine-generating enzyme required for sulfatase activity
MRHRRSRIHRGLQQAHAASTGVAVGAPTRASAGRRTTTGTSLLVATMTLAFASGGSFLQRKAGPRVCRQAARGTLWVRHRRHTAQRRNLQNLLPISQSRLPRSPVERPVPPRPRPSLRSTPRAPRSTKPPWDEATGSCRKLSELPQEQAAHTTCRLPTEAEWEYGYRAGTTTTWYSGDDEATLRKHACFSANAGGKTHPAGQRLPNAWGLYDMHGKLCIAELTYACQAGMPVCRLRNSV